MQPNKTPENEQRRAIETPWMTTDEAAVYLRRSARTLTAWRGNKIGPPWHQPSGPRGDVMYHRDELDTWQRGAPPPAEGEKEDTDNSDAQ